jgi:gentisate 1,2-dioxygenase
MSAIPKPSNQAARQSFYKKIDGASVTPLWEVLHSLIPPAPKTPCLPALYKWRELHPWVMESGGLITAMEAERRVLILENPGLRGESRITHSLYAGLQLIMPGEIAPAHRHSQSALRFIMEGSGAYTAVEGERVTMRPGDFIITPSWTWHDHGNPGNEPVIWLDGLDIPIIELFDAQFLERHDQPSQTTTRTEGESFARYGATMLPLDHKPSSHTSPLWWYPYERTREALAQLAKVEDPHPCHGHKLQYVNPATGGSAMPTIGTFMQLLPKGFSGKSYRSTDSTVFAVAEGKGRVTFSDETLEFEPQDVFVMPSWGGYSLHADTECVLFSFSDRPVQQALDLWREAS